MATFPVFMMVVDPTPLPLINIAAGAIPTCALTEYVNSKAPTNTGMYVFFILVLFVL
jgi:hypothetical protein